MSASPGSATRTADGPASGFYLPLHNAHLQSMTCFRMGGITEFDRRRSRAASTMRRGSRSLIRQHSSGSISVEGPASKNDTAPSRRLVSGQQCDRRRSHVDTQRTVALRYKQTVCGIVIPEQPDRLPVGTCDMVHVARQISSPGLHRLDRSIAPDPVGPMAWRTPREPSDTALTASAGSRVPPRKIPLAGHTRGHSCSG